MNLFFSKLSHKAVFIIAILLGMSAILTYFGYNKWTQRKTTVDSHVLTRDVSVTEQIKLEAIPTIVKQGFKTIIDLRPDGEVPDQPSSANVESSAKNYHLSFAYIPVPHGEIPDSAVNGLSNAMLTNPKPILLYCRSGRRAARTWSLAEASRIGGLQALAILTAVKNGGQSADDLELLINRRIANRK